MPRGQIWTPEEDEAIRAAARDTLRKGLTRSLDERERAFAAGDLGALRPGYANRLRAVAEELGRTYAAVRKRAERIGATSYRGELPPISIGSQTD